MVRKAISYEKRLEIIHLKKHTTQSYMQIAARVDVSEKCVRTTWRTLRQPNHNQPPNQQRDLYYFIYMR